MGRGQTGGQTRKRTRLAQKSTEAQAAANEKSYEEQQSQEAWKDNLTFFVGMGVLWLVLMGMVLPRVFANPTGDRSDAYMGNGTENSVRSGSGNEAHMSWLASVIKMQKNNEFHPVLIPPKGIVFTIMDLTVPLPKIENIPNPECKGIKKTMKLCESFIPPVPTIASFYKIGKYNEDRQGMYETELFKNESYGIDGFSGARTIHIGLDLGGPVGEPIYSFADGKIYSAGYNSEKGDYGNVVVTEHSINGKYVYALYGHLDEKSIIGKVDGVTEVKKGDIIGYLGGEKVNGGWPPHVHFQISLRAPVTNPHDMPGVVSEESRARGLIEYPDPRILLGNLY